MTAYALRSITVDLQHFAPWEFRESWPLMAGDLLRALDDFRAQIGVPLELSPAKGALARALDSDGSLHNVDRHGFVYAADVLVPASMTLREAYNAAVDSGLFSGVGAYPHWSPRPGLHLDVRHVVSSNPTPNATPSSPATWAGIDDGNGGQEYVAAAEVFNGGYA